MWNQFFLENVHFAVSLFMALVLFAISWLYWDSSAGRKNPKEGFKILGLLLLSISFVIQATALESSLLTASFIAQKYYQAALTIFRIGGYLALIFGLLLDKLQERPFYGLKKAPLVIPTAVSLSAFSPLSMIFFPILSAVCALLYLRRATIGLESHLKPVVLGFFALSIYELLFSLTIFENTASIDLYKIVAPFGIVWILRHVVLLVSALILGKWVSVYLTKRFQSQLFMMFTCAILTIFLITTVSFSALLLGNLQSEALARIETDAKVLNFAIDSKKSENLASAQMLAQMPQVIEEVSKSEREGLFELAESLILTKNLSTVVIVSGSGQVLARGEDRDRVLDSLSGDPLIKRALLGESAVSIVTKEGVIAPEVSVRAAVPVKSEQEIAGAVMTGSVIDNAFVDGIKNATGLDASIYADKTLSATTISSQDGKTRYLGIQEQNPEILKKVLAEGKSYNGPVNLLNVPYFASYLSLKDLDNAGVGMLFVGRAQIGVLQTAAKSIELTFIITALLIVFSIIPSYAIAKYLTGQIH